jgi:hypothetical protein
MAHLKPGAKIWIPCDVKPGPFANERIVKVEHAEGVWVGFVPVSELKDPVPLEGKTQIRAVVVESKPTYFLARLPGHSLSTSNIFRGAADRVTQVAVTA